MSTFERMDLAQFDGFPAAEWYEEVDQYDEEGELETPMPNGDVYEACEDGAYIAHVYKRNATAIIVNAPRFLAALRAAYEEMDNNDEAIQSYARTVVRMQAEIDRLRALIPVWTTYDGTPETLPPVGSKIYQISAYHHEFMGFRESETTWGEIWGGGYRLWSISVGERWAPAMYDPDPPKYRKVEEGEVKA